ncbi:MAG: carbonic anhydrase/acetyltransferase-like protein (isoleucine patch superfamily) [Parasphingorhabdus sp.]|jgi:carbonic anhydrase/acetyltransferase-like protein (isoleucine patch superfamily)
MIYSYEGISPTISPDAFITDEATVIGNATIHSGASVWFGSVIRADNDLVQIGKNSNIQDGSVIHTDPGFQVLIGESVTIGHRVVLHGCEINSCSLIGINSVVLNGARVGSHCLIGANSMITSNKVIPDRSLVMGSPAKVIRELTDDECAEIEQAARIYCQKVASYRATLRAVESES